jgi:hypothetical protein
VKAASGSADRSRPTGHPGARFGVPLALFLLSAPAAAQVAPRDSAWLVGTAQQLLDAVTAGDSAAWARHLAPDWTLSDEEGRLVGRAEFLAGLRPLPEGQSGKLRIGRRHLAGRPGVAVMSYDAEEEHRYHGQLLRTVFRVTDTWVRRGGRWEQLASQVTALPWPLAGRPIPPQLARDYAGIYTLTADIGLRISAADSGLRIERADRPAEPLHALDDRLFVRHGIRGFWVFERDSLGRVDRLVNWRDNNPVVWQRER